MPGWVCQWKPFWIPVGFNFQKAYLEEWLHIGDDSTGDPGENSIEAISTANVSTMVRSSENQNCTVRHKQPMDANSEPRPLGQPDAPTWELLGPQGTASFWERTEAPMPPPKRRYNFIHPKQLSPFPERMKLPFSSEEILSGYEDVVSSSQDLYTTWVKTDPDVTSERHMVDIQKAVADYREAAARRQEPTTQEYFFDTNMPKRSYVQKRLSIYNLNPGSQLKGKSQASGALSPCRRRLIMSTMNSSPTGSMLPTTEASRCFSTMTPSSTLTLKSSPFTSMIPSENCLKSDGRRPGSAFTCLILSISSRLPENIHSSVLSC